MITMEVKLTRLETPEKINRHQISSENSKIAIQSYHFHYPSLRFTNSVPLKKSYLELYLLVELTCLMDGMRKINPRRLKN